MSFSRIVLYTVFGLLITTLALAATLYVAARGTYHVADTVMTDPSLPAIEVNGLRLHAETHGSAQAPVVIVLHGGPGGDYAGLLPLRALADTYRVAFYDQRGAGLSERVAPTQLTLDDYLSELDAIIDQMSPDAPVTLIGHSWGAMLASAYLGEHPTKVEKAVLMEPGYLSAKGFEDWKAQSKAYMSGIGFLKSAIWNGFRAAHVDGPDDAASGDFLLGQMVAGFANHPDNSYHCPGQPFDMPEWRFGATASKAANATPAADLDRITPANKVSAPVLLIAGTCSSWIGASLQREHLRLFENARLALVADAGHAMITDNPAATLAEIRSFLEE